MARAEKRRWRRGLLVLVGFVILGYLLPVAVALSMHGLDRPTGSLWQTRRDSSEQAPVAAAEAVIQVYAARAYGWRGVLGVHTWIAAKPAGSDHYTRYEVMGWGVRYGRAAIRVRSGDPDSYWFGNRPRLLADLRGEQAEQVIRQLTDAVDRYPYPRDYRVWPGPNSNTFIAELGRQLPDLQLELPPTAIGKDYLPEGRWFDWTPSGQGVQLSLNGLFGVLIGLDEGIEINLLGLVFGIDINEPAIKLPGLGRLGMNER